MTYSSIPYFIPKIRLVNNDLHQEMKPTKRKKKKIEIVAPYLEQFDYINESEIMKTGTCI